MKLLFYLFIIINSLTQAKKEKTEYNFDYYTIYQVKWSNQSSFKKIYLTHTANPNYILYVKTNDKFMVESMELYDRDEDYYYNFKFPENTVLNNIKNVNQIIENYQKIPISWEAIKNNKNRHFKAKEVAIDDFTHIELNFYKNKKKTKLDHTIYIETQNHPTIKNQFYASGLNFFYYNLALNSINTQQFITKVYRTDNEKMSAEENLLQIKPTAVKINLNK
jgi:hypothetical protein